MPELKTLLVLPALLLLAFTANAQKTGTPDPDQAKRELRVLEQKWLQAEADPVMQQQILADDFVHVLPSGFISKKDQIDFLRSGKRPPDQLKKNFDDLKVRIYGTIGIVNGIVVATDKSGKPVRKTLFTDVFAYRHGHWQAVNSQENNYQLRAN